MALQIKLAWQKYGLDYCGGISMSKTWINLMMRRRRRGVKSFRSMKKMNLWRISFIGCKISGRWYGKIFIKLHRGWGVRGGNIHLILKALASNTSCEGCEIFLDLCIWSPVVSLWNYYSLRHKFRWDSLNEEKTHQWRFQVFLLDTIYVFVFKFIPYGKTVSKKDTY